MNAKNEKREGMPFSLVADVERNPIDWLSSLCTVTKHLTALRPDLDAHTKTRLKKASDIAALAAKNIQDEKSHNIVCAAMIALQNAWLVEIDLGAKTRIIRDNKRQAGTKAKRQPQINDWIRRQLRRKPDATTRELWERAPKEVTDAIASDRFKKRVTEVRKEFKKWVGSQVIIDPSS